MAEPNHASHFESLERQAAAVRLGTWVFLASEVLFFAALFTLYATYRSEHPDAFAAGIRAGEKTIGSINTVILLISSFFVAAAVHVRREVDLRGTRRHLGFAIALGTIFLALKGYEYSLHIAHGMVPGAIMIEGHAYTGASLFFTLYFLTTGLHALHVVGGLVLLVGCMRGARSGREEGPSPAHRLEAVGLYWHLVDAIWIMVWPLYYLSGGAR